MSVHTPSDLRANSPDSRVKTFVFFPHACTGRFRFIIYVNTNKKTIVPVNLTGHQTAGHSQDLYLDSVDSAISSSQSSHCGDDSFTDI